MKQILISVVIHQILLSTLYALQNSPCISFKGLKGVDVFQSNDVTTYSHLLFDVKKKQVIVGARDNLYRVSLQDLTLLENVTWQVTIDDHQYCTSIGGTEDDCHNYIKVLLRNGSKLLACGTHALKPLCTWRKMENMTDVSKKRLGNEIYPSLPSQTVTSLLASNVKYGLFVGGEVGRTSHVGMISKDYTSQTIHSLPHESQWLNQPRFVGSFETEAHVYFLFHEYATECTFHDKKITHSRIARVCKNDPGTGQQLRRWTTFMKARLSCYTPGDVPFYYDHIQSLVYLSENKTLYATFTTPMSGIPGSAICAFNLKDIEQTFAGSFEHQPESGMMCLPRNVSMHLGKTCSLNTSLNQMHTSQRYILMHNAVESATPRPIYLDHMERFTQITVEKTLTETVLYVATTTGLIKKISFSSKTQKSCLIEVWGPLPSPILTMKFLKHTQSIYIGTESSVLRIPVAQCRQCTHPQGCLNTQDPYCMWNENSNQCDEMPLKVNKCPVADDTEGHDGYLTTSDGSNRSVMEIAATNCSKIARELMMDKRRQRLLFLYEFSLGHNATVATQNINKALGSNTVKKYKLKYWFKIYRKHWTPLFPNSLSER